jgi:DNA-binding FadR family transcriptional regulator
MHDLAGVDLPLTQEFLAQMMGVRRTSVTEVAGELQKAGLITYSRGHVHIEAIERIQEHACEFSTGLRPTPLDETVWGVLAVELLMVGLAAVGKRSVAH